MALANHCWMKFPTDCRVVIFSAENPQLGATPVKVAAVLTKTSERQSLAGHATPVNQAIREYKMSKWTFGVRR